MQDFSPGEIYIANILAVDFYAPASNVVRSLENLEQGGLASARRSNKRNGLASGNVQRNILNDIENF
jgi:hypothetical protein